MEDCGPLAKTIRTDICWIEIVEDGAVGLDFGWPAQGSKFAYLGPCPRIDETWVEVLSDWLDNANCEGDGVEHAWTRAYLEADGVRDFLSAVFGAEAPGICALVSRLSSRNLYLAFALFQIWDSNDDDDGESGQPAAPDLSPKGHRVLQLQD